MTLSDSTRVTIRPIRPDDGPRLEAAYRRLSPDTRYKRFLAPKPHLSAAEVRYLVEIDGRDHVALVATLDSDPERIVAVGRFVRLPEDPRAAEFAIVVSDALQGQGLGTALVERMGEAATERGITRFRATTLIDNAPVHRLIERQSAGRTRHRHRGALDEVEFDLAG